MSLPGANEKLIELAVIAQKNRTAFDFFLSHLADAGFETLHSFVHAPNALMAGAVIESFLDKGLTGEAALLDGLGRPYPARKGAWLLMGWTLRDSPVQRLQSLRSACEPDPRLSADAILLNRSRQSAAQALPDREFWTWPAVMLSMLGNLEGSRRALKGYAIEEIVRETLSGSLEKMGLALRPSDKAVTVDGESYDIEVLGGSRRLFLSVKTRETGGGGHSHIFSRDIAAAARKAQAKGGTCIPVIVSAHWKTNLSETGCEDAIHVPFEPHDKDAIVAQLKSEFARREGAFRALTAKPVPVAGGRATAAISA